MHHTYAIRLRIGTPYECTSVAVYLQSTPGNSTLPPWVSLLAKVARRVDNVACNIVQPSTSFIGSPEVVEDKA